jgi:SAM-dependent methyltransferase
MDDQSLYFKQGPNLAVYRRIQEQQQFWERRWQGMNLKALLKNARRGQLGEMERPYRQYLPKEGPILEAGCGTGRIVCALQARGYTVEGIDYAAETIQRVCQVDPSLNVRVGDILAIDRLDGYYAGYISLGVLEHHIEGVQPGLKEAWRVLRPGGIAFIMVPYLNRARQRTYARAPEFEPSAVPAGYRFYQYQEDIGDFNEQLARTGFEILEVIPTQLFEGLTSDWRLGRWLEKRHFFSWKVNQAIKRLCEGASSGIKLGYSHMLLFVCVKRG